MSNAGAPPPNLLGNVAGAAPAMPWTQQNQGGNTSGQQATQQNGSQAGYYEQQANANGQTGNGYGNPAAAFGQQQGGANAYANGLNALGNSFLGQQAPGANQFTGQVSADQAAYGQQQQAQQANLAQLYSQATGGTANPAAATMAAGTAQAQAQQQALAHSQGIGGAASMAGRSALNNNATLGINNANQTAQANAAYQANAAQQYQQAAAQYAQQGQQYQQGQQALGAAYGGMQENQNVANASNQIGALQQANQVQQGQLTSDTNQAVGAAQVGTNATLAQNAASASATNSAIGASTAAGGATLAMLSDERLKGDIRGEGSDSLADRFMEHLHPYSFRYRDAADEPADGAPTGGRYMGVMAQDVERTPEIGAQLVKNTPRGKALSGPATMSALAAGVGRLHERLKALEDERSAGRKGGEA